jgi:hypothetical protein
MCTDWMAEWGCLLTLNGMAVFCQAIFEGYVDRGKRAKLKYENDNYSLDHAEPEKFR